MTKTNPKKNKYKKVKWFSEVPCLEVRKEEKWKAREKGKKYQTECRVPKIARKDKKAFLSEKCKEIEENTRIGKNSDLFKKTGDIKGTFHATHEYNLSWSTSITTNTKKTKGVCCL